MSAILSYGLAPIKVTSRAARKPGVLGEKRGFMSTADYKPVTNISYNSANPI